MRFKPTFFHAGNPVDNPQHLVCYHDDPQPRERRVQQQPAENKSAKALIDLRQKIQQLAQELRATQQHTSNKRQQTHMRTTAESLERAGFARTTFADGQTTDGPDLLKTRCVCKENSFQICKILDHLQIRQQHALSPRK